MKHTDQSGIDADFSSYSVLELIPHGAPMSLLDNIVSYQEESLQAMLSIRSDSPFCGENGVPAYVGIEYMGQAIAAFAGAEARTQNVPITVGFLVGARKYSCNCAIFKIGSTLYVEVNRITEAGDGLSVFACTIQGSGPSNEAIELSANLNVFVPDDVEDYFERSA